MFFEAEMAFNELTSTALQLYDEWIKDAGKMINKTLNSVPEAKYLNKYEKYCCFIGKQIIKKIYTDYSSYDDILLFMQRYN